MDERTYRKQRPVYSGVLKYFPDALLEVANVSFMGNEQHNPGTPLHWDRSKSTDEPDALARHLLDAGTRDTDGTRHSAKVAWRALAMLQKEIEAERKPTVVISGELGEITAYSAGTHPAEFDSEIRACPSRSGGYLCTLDFGHKGKHIATIPGGEVVRTWEGR
jgi:hypothetical protein